MTAYVARRLLQVIPVLLGITLVAFVLVRLTGDPAAIMLPPETPKEAVAAFRSEFGLDLPLPVQYARFVGNALRGDFGRSIRYREPVADLFKERIGATLELALGAMLIGLVLGIPMGIISAVRRNTWIDAFVRVTALIGQAI